MTLQAMALYDYRHIIQFDINTIKTNEEFSKLMSISEICDVQFKKDQIIFACDECEEGLSKFTRKKPTQNTDTNTDPLVQICTTIANKEDSLGKLIREELIPINSDNSTQLNIGTILSKLDGIGNYNGMIIVFLTNFMDKLDDALLRDGRLTPIEFKKLRKIDVIELIEHQFNIKLSNEQKEQIADRYITPATFSHTSEHYDESNIDDFISQFLSNRTN